MSSEKKICVVNAHWSNRGDEAALRPLVNAICQNVSDVELTVIFKDRKEVQQFPYDGNVKHFSSQYLPDSLEEVWEIVRGQWDVNLGMRRMIDTLKRSDVIVYSPGGAVISDKFWWRKQLEYLIPFICAKEYHIPIVVAAPSMGPFDLDERKNRYRREWLSAAEKICVREPLSARYLKELGIDSVVTTIDTAFYDEPDRQENEKKFREQTKLVKFFAEHERVVGVTLSDFSWNVEYMNKEELPERLKKTFQAFVKKINAEHYGILLIPQLFGNQNDSEYLTQFESEDTFLLSDEWDTYFQQYIISKCYSLVGMRYHSNIFAAKMGVPFVAIGYEEKMYGFMEEHGLTDYLIKIDDLCEKSLLEKWTKLVDTYPKYRDVLLCKRESWRELAAQTIQCVLDVVC